MEKLLRMCLLRIRILFLFIFSITCAFGNNDSLEVLENKKKWFLNGYVKFLQQNAFAPNIALQTTNLIHQRLNASLRISPVVDFKFSIRNRLFYGQQSGLDISANLIKQSTNLFDLNTSWLQQENLLGNTCIDRAYLSYLGKKWEVSIGRQRINWGVNTVWNPNDVFNAFNFIDFDYVERPGSDAVRMQRFGDKATVEFALKPAKHDSLWVAGLMAKWNVKQYDIQVLSGRYFNDYFVGTGWAGNVFNAGFKGEATYFISSVSTPENKALSMSVSLDYGFSNGWYVLGSALYNKTNQSTASAFGSDVLLNSNALSAKQLMPVKYSYLIQANKAIDAAWTMSVACIYLGEINAIFAMPSISYQIKDNWQMDFTGQHMVLWSPVKNTGNSVFFRLQHHF